MPPSPTQFTALLLQSAGAILLAAVFRSFYRFHARGYLLDWTWSWVALALHFLGMALARGVLAELPPDGALRLANASMVLAFGYLHLAWLLYGIYELATGDTVPARTQGLALVASALFGVMSALLFGWGPEAELGRVTLRYALPAGAGAAAYLLSAAGIWRAHRGDRGSRFGRVPPRERGFGVRLLAGAFVVFGLEQLQYLALSGLTLARATEPGYAAYLGFLDLLIQIALGFGLVIWLMEDERRSTIDAAAQVEHLAYHDTLTGLPNRRLLLDRLSLAIAHAARGGHMLAIFFLDLDRFKLINDSLGHSTGDRLLKSIAGIMRGLLREEDTVARIGGDEFTILAPRVKGVDDVLTVARKVRDALKQPVAIDGRDLYISTSIGISLYPSDGPDGETLLKNADAAMYRAKTQGRDTFQLYAPAMNERALEQLALESSLRRAAAKDELLLHYQPVVEMRTGNVVSVETVLRWQHPALGLLLPDNFISLAEATGLIVPIGAWVLETACAQVREWQRQGSPNLRAAVNLSVRQLQQPEFFTMVTETLQRTTLAPHALELEITESVAMQAAEGVTEKLRELKRLGVRISIDDFGTGYSSISALRLYPVDALKIDKAFVRDISAGGGGERIAAAVIALARSLDLGVIAEGVETSEQLAFLRDAGCDRWQGYLLSAPIPAADCGAILRSRSAVASFPWHRTERQTTR